MGGYYTLYLLSQDELKKIKSEIFRSNLKKILWEVFELYFYLKWKTLEIEIWTDRCFPTVATFEPWQRRQKLNVKLAKYLTNGLKFKLYICPE